MVDNGCVFGALSEEMLNGLQPAQTLVGFFKTTVSDAGELGELTVTLTTASEVAAMSPNAANPGQFHIIVKTEMNRLQLEYWLFDTTQQKAVSRAILQGSVMGPLETMFLLR